MVILLVAGHEPKQYVAGHKIVNARIGLIRKPGTNRAPMDRFCLRTRGSGIPPL